MGKLGFVITFVIPLCSAVWFSSLCSHFLMCKIENYLPISERCCEAQYIQVSALGSLLDRMEQTCLGREVGLIVDKAFPISTFCDFVEVL